MHLADRRGAAPCVARPRCRRGVPTRRSRCRPQSGLDGAARPANVDFPAPDIPVTNTLAMPSTVMSARVARPQLGTVARSAACLDAWWDANSSARSTGSSRLPEVRTSRVRHLAAGNPLGHTLDLQGVPSRLPHGAASSEPAVRGGGPSALAPRPVRTLRRLLRGVRSLESGDAPRRCSTSLEGVTLL